jgi:hypothetical protein
MGPKERARVRLAHLYEEMDAIHHANGLYWKQGKAQTPTARADYAFRNERLGKIRAQLAELRSELADVDRVLGRKPALR